jgi:hypothetical protein
MTSRPLNHASVEEDGEPLCWFGLYDSHLERRVREMAAAGTVLRLQRQPMGECGQTVQ